MSAFCEKYHVTPEYYQHKMSIPQIALMSMDAPRIHYSKKPANNNNVNINKPADGKKKNIQSVSDVIGLISKK